MAASAKYLRFTKQAGTGVQSVTGVGFQGKALILWTTRRASLGCGDGAQMLVGMTDGIDQVCRFIHHPDNEATTTSAQAERTNRLVYMTNATSGATPTLEVEGDFDGFTADGFDIDWLTNDGQEAIIHAIVMGGADLQVDYTPTKINVDTGGTIAVTTGFAPDCFIVIGGASDEFGTGDVNLGSPFGSIHGFGFSDASANVCGWTLEVGGGGSDCYRGQHTDRCASIRIANLSGAGDLCSIRISAKSATGYTISRIAGGLSHQPVEHVLAIKGLRFSLGSFSTPEEASDYTLSLPFQPTLLIAQTHGLNSATGDGMSLAIGAWCESDSGGMWIGGTDAANPSVFASADHSGHVLQHRQPDATGSASAVDVEASVSSTSGDGAVLTFSAVPASPVSVLYIALAPSDGLSAGDDFSDGDPGPLATITLTDKSGTVHAFTDVDGMSDRTAYTDAPGGYKLPRVLSYSPIRRALSGAQGGIEHPSFGASVSDTDNRLRALLEDDTAKYLTNRPLVVRTFTDAARRAELPQHIEMCGYVSRYSPRETFRFDLEGTSWPKKKLARKTPAPEYWQVPLTREDWPLLPDELLNKAAPLQYGRVSDEVEAVDLGDIPADLYPRGSYDPGWIDFGYNGWGTGSFGTETVYTWLTTIKDGVESTVIPGSFGFAANGASPAFQARFRCAALPDRFRFYISDSPEFQPFTNPLAGTYARYIDVDPADVPEGNNPFGGPDPDDAQKRFFLIDSASQGEDYHALVSDGAGGTIDAAKGAWATLYVGELTIGGVTRSTFLSGYHVVDTMEGVFVGGQRATNVGSAYEIECPHLGDFASVFGANYITINGRRWTPIFATGQTAINAINGTAPITVNRGGYETVGDTTGTRITSPVRIDQHYARNFLAANTVPGGNWLTVSPTLPTGARMVDDESYDAAEAALQARISGGYEAAGGISVCGEYESAADILASLARDGGFDRGTSRQGAMMVTVEPSSAPSDADVHILTDILDIVDRSFGVRVELTQNFWNKWSVQHTKDYTGQTQTGWLLTGEVSDDASITNYEQEMPAPAWPMRWLRAASTQGSDTIIDVLQRARTRYRHPLRTVTLTVPYRSCAGVELGDVLRLDHVEGLGASGWSGHDVRVTAIETDLNQWVRKFEGYDLQPIYDGLEDDVAPSSQNTGLRKDTITSLQERVNTTQADVSTVQAEIVAIDGELADLPKRGRVRVATTANITISTALNNGDTLDGVTLATGDLVLVKNQTASEENGVYIVGASPARSGQFDTYDEHPGSLIAVAEGSANADTLWLCVSNMGGTLNTTGITFTKLTLTLDVMSGDSGFGGIKGLVPAPAAGDAAAGKFLKADGTFAVPSGGGGGGSGSLVLLEQHTASSSASLDFTASISSTYDEYLIELIQLVPATNGVDLYIRVSTDGGATYDSSSKYVTSVFTWVHDATAAAGNALGSPSAQWLVRGAADGTNDSNYGVTGSARLFNPGGSAYKRFHGSFSYQTGSVYAGVETRSVYLNASAVDAFRFLFSSGNIASGTIRVYGIVK